MASVIETVLKSMECTLTAQVLKSKFRGCLLGGLMGDCLGSPFEGDDYNPSNATTVQKYFDKLAITPSGKDLPEKLYTDDTAMMKSVAKCLLEKPAVDCVYLAKLFVKEYFTEPNRGYGQNVTGVFKKLRTSKFSDPFKPAAEQFDGNGSYGNGGAMRIAPAALFFFSDYGAMVNASKEMTKVTHTNKNGINGAVLQSIAIRQSLLQDPNKELNVSGFMDQLLQKMQDVETDDEELGLGDPYPYQTQLKEVKKLLEAGDEVSDEEAVQKLGHDISALYSVPTAIYCFLRAQKNIPNVSTDDKLRRTIQYAISLGGDTDTIACMAGNIAGAFYGDGTINKTLLKHCESHEEISEIADELFEAIAS